MPLTETVSNFFVAEYDRFQEGLQGLTPDGRAEELDRRRKELAERPGGATISIPGWDDVIHLAPRERPPKEAYREFFRAQREGRPPDLPPDQVREIIRRRGRMEAFRTTAQPGYSQAFGQILTALDNVGDMLTTIAVVGRLALWPAAKILGRTIPGVGMVLLARDVLNLLAWFGALALPAYAAYCRSSAEVFAAAVPAALFGRALKRPAKLLSDLNPFSRVSRARRALKAARVFPTISNLLEVAQTTDQLFGVGISFGGIVGAIMEGSYGAIRAVKGEPVRVQVAPGSKSILDLYKSGILDLTPQDLATRQQAARALRDLPFVMRAPALFTEEELTGALAAALAATDLLGADLRGRNWPEFVYGQAAALFPIDADPDPGARELIAEVDPAFESLARWPWPDGPSALSMRDYVETTAQEVPPALFAWLSERRDTLEGAFVGALVNTLADRLWLLLEEDPTLFHTELTPEYKALELLAEVNRVVNVHEPEAAIMAFWVDLVGEIQWGHRARLTGRDLDQLAARRGLTLIKLRAP